MERNGHSIPGISSSRYRGCCPAQGAGSRATLFVAAPVLALERGLWPSAEPMDFMFQGPSTSLYKIVLSGSKKQQRTRSERWRHNHRGTWQRGRFSATGVFGTRSERTCPPGTCKQRSEETAKLQRSSVMISETALVAPLRRQSGTSENRAVKRPRQLRALGSGFEQWRWWRQMLVVIIGVQAALWTGFADALASHAEAVTSGPVRLVYEAYGVLKENHIQQDQVTRDWLDAALQPNPPQDFSTARHRIVEHLIRPLHDRYTRLVAPDQFARLMRFDATGLGLLLRSADTIVSEASRLRLSEEQPELGVLPRVPVSPGDLYIASPPLAGTAAAAAGLQAGDVIDRINGEDVRGGRVPPFEAAALMQGDEGGKVVLELRGRGRVELVREYPSLVDSSAARVVEFERLGRTGIIHVREFNAWTLPRVESALSQLLGTSTVSASSEPNTGADAIERLVLDLRRNHGGSLEEALDLAGLFLGGSVPVALFEGSRGEAVPIASREPNRMLAAAQKLPLVVLIDHETASASEVLAGALRDHCRAVLVSVGFAPDHTYGKAMVQGVYGLSDGSALIVTIGRYVTPVRHEELQGRGLRAERHVLGLWSLVPMPLRAALAEQELSALDIGKRHGICEQPGIALTSGRGH